MSETIIPGPADANLTAWRTSGGEIGQEAARAAVTEITGGGGAVTAYQDYERVDLPATAGTESTSYALPTRDILLPLAVTVIAGGTVGASETIQATLHLVYADNSTADAPMGVLTAGATTRTPDLNSIPLNGQKISSLAVSGQTNTANTGAHLSVFVTGLK